MRDLIMGMALLICLFIAGWFLFDLWRWGLRWFRRRRDTPRRLRAGWRPSPEEWEALIEGESDETVREWIAKIRAMRDAARRAKK